MGGAQPLAATMNGAAFLGVDVDESRIRRRVETRYCDVLEHDLDSALRALDEAKARRRPLSVGLVGNIADVLPELARRVLCRKCAAVHHVTFFDKAAVHGCFPGEAKKLASDDWRAFMDQHAGHRLEPLKALGEEFFPGGMPGDPMAVAYLKVTAGQREFFLRRFRWSIAEPLKFELIEGGFEHLAPTLEIQERELRKELTLRFRYDGQALSDAKVDLFIALFRGVMSAVETSSVTATEPSHEDDNIAYAALPTTALDLLLKQCGSYFTSTEVQALRRFTETHNGGSDVMTLVLRRSTVFAVSL